MSTQDCLRIPKNGNTWLCDATVDTRSLIEALGWIEVDPETDLGIEDWAELDLAEEAEAIDEALGMTEETWDNTYNSENDLSHDLDFRVWGGDGDYLYNECWILLRVHRGGDPRGNYGGSEVYRCPDGLSGLFYASTLMWAAEDAQGEPIESCAYDLWTVLEDAQEGDNSEDGAWEDGAFVLKNGARLFPMVSEG
jgi:hypothetical protein